MEEQSLKKVMYALAAVAVVLAGALAYIWYQKSSLVKELTVEKEELTEQMIALQNDYATLSSDYDDINLQLDSSRVEVQMLIEKITKTEATNRSKIRQYERELGTLRSIMKNYITQIDSLNTLNKQLTADAAAARREAAELVSEANRTIENTIKAIRESQAEKELTRTVRKELTTFAEESVFDWKAHEDKLEAEMQRLARRRERREQRAREREEMTEKLKPVEPAPLKIEVGSKVRIEGQEIPGVVQLIKGKKAQVAFGQMIMMVEMSRLKGVSSAEFKRATRTDTPRTVVSVDIRERKLNFRDHIDVRGMRSVEALAMVEDLIDDALMVGVSGVTILHGKGTGALKEEIRKYLRTVPNVDTIKDDHADRGGAGITVVTFKRN